MEVNRKFLLIAYARADVRDIGARCDLRNIGANSIFASAKAKGIDIKLLYIDVDIALNQAAFERFLREEQFGVVGISVMTMDYYYSVDLTAMIREILPNAFIFWGGVHPTSEPEECLSSGCDCVSIGEGEEAVVQIVKNYENRNVLETLDGVGLKRSDGTFQINKAACVEDINALPFPYYEFDGDFYILDGQTEQVRRLSLEDYVACARHGGDGYCLTTSRSCPYNCSYCINSYYNKLYRAYGAGRFSRRRSVKNTIAEIKYARETIPTVKFINFFDDHFLENDSWLHEFADSYGREIGLPFLIRVTPEAATESRIKLLKEAGLYAVEMGIQSGCAETHRNIFHRNFDREAILSVARLLNRYNIDSTYDFIIGNEFESVEAKKSTIKLMMELPKPYHANTFHIIPYPKTDIIKWYRENNITPKLDPYKTTHLEFEEDVFAVLASLVPAYDNEVIQKLLDTIECEETQEEIRRLYKSRRG